MNFIKSIVVLFALLALTACGSKFKTYSGPEVTRVVVQKEARMLYLMHNDEILKSYKIDLGFAPVGHKQVEGDGRTPEGQYFINRKNPNSAFHLSLGISYPNNADRKRAKELGKSTGGDIFIHGGPRRGDKRGADWTAGCISVSNRKIEEIYSMVRQGTPIFLNP